jgi:hypothetical protein
VPEVVTDKICLIPLVGFLVSLCVELDIALSMQYGGQVPMRLGISIYSTCRTCMKGVTSHSLLVGVSYTATSCQG